MLEMALMALSPTRMAVAALTVIECCILLHCMSLDLAHCCRRPFGSRPLHLDIGQTRETIPGFTPTVLRQFYAAVGGCLETVCRQNRILAPCELRQVGGKLQFAVENQYVYSWAIDSDEPDPPVLGRFEGTGTWAVDVPVLSLFLTQFVLFELLMQAPFGASVSWLDKPRADLVLSDMTVPPFPYWHWPAYPARFLVRRNALAFVCPSGHDLGEDGPYCFWVGAKDASELQFIKPRIDATWEYTSFESGS